MLRAILAAGAALLVLLSSCAALSGISEPTPLAPAVTSTPHATLPTGLPGRATSTPAGEDPFARRTPAPTPQVTSPFTFPTTPPEISPTPPQDCTAIFPLDSVEAIDFGRTTIPQLEAAFGQAEYQGGRPTRFRFEEQGCNLIITVTLDTADEAELPGYGTLGLLLDHYGTPDAAGVSEGTLSQPLASGTLLFYPEQGVIAVFDDEPDALRRDTPPSSLILRSPYDLEPQMKRMSADPVEWQPPLR